LVYVEKLLDILEEKLEKLVCIYCEKIFKSREVLKEHMRKKNHKKINPRDSNYDKYYLVNYLEFGKSWEKSSKDKSDKPFEVRDIQKLRAQFFLTIGQNNFGNKIPI
jgi:hypothetical protein